MHAKARHIPKRETKNTSPRHSTSPERLRLAEVACGTRSRSAAPQTLKIYGFHPWSKGSGKKKKVARAIPQKTPRISEYDLAPHLEQISLHGWHMSQKNSKMVSTVALLMETANAA